MAAPSKTFPAFPDILPLDQQQAHVSILEDGKQQARRVGFEFGYIPELDGVRGVAILCVVFGHFLEFHSASPMVRALARSVAQSGVLLFFVLSGFLITGLLYRERQQTADIRFRHFYLRRILRLAPALFLFILAVVILMSWRRIADVAPLEILECVFYSRNLVGHSMTLGHIWSLSLEEQFYLVWPLTFCLLPLRRMVLSIAAVCGAFAIWRGAAIALHLFPYDQGYFYVRPYFRFDSILIGALLLAFFYQSAPVYEKLKTLANGFSTLTVSLIWTLWALAAESVFPAIYITVEEVLAVILLGKVLLTSGDQISGLLRSRTLTYIGAISYPLYLWQQLFVTADNPSWGPLRQFPLALILPFLIAAISYRLVEKPALQLKNLVSAQSVLFVPSRECGRSA
jgi:peptidoglycan/LPS O-acetylase OafA/YrhL